MQQLFAGSARGALVLVVVLSTGSAGLAQQAAAPPTTNYAGYAHQDCGPSGSPAVRIVLPAGSVPVPAVVPKSAPRPAVELLVSAPVERVAGQPIPFAQALTAGGPLSVIGLSCPVVGDCSRALEGTLTIERRADGALTGEFRAMWPDDPVRATMVVGRFVAAWRDVAAKCE